jgi:hypothetical protein
MPSRPLPRRIEVGEPHLDFFSLVARGLVGIALGDLASEVGRAFVDRAQHFAGRSVGAAARLQRAWPAVVHAGPVAEQIVFRQTGPRLGEPPAIARSFRTEFAADSPLEEDGFELAVPPRRERL